jgi:predicted RNA binding protein YcfA (HicA-like mRNA interferase family)
VRPDKHLHRELTRLGFELHRDGGGGHRIYRHPNGGPQLTVSRSPSDHYAIANALGDAKRILKGHTA